MPVTSGISSAVSGRDSARTTNGHINAVAQFVEELPQGRVFDGPAGRIRFQVALGHIGGVLGAVDQNVVPGLILGRPGSGHDPVPVLAALEAGIGIEDHPAVIEKLVPDDLADLESGL